ncbi:Diphthine synthase [Nesidiocoris tenuis]|uniref:diphthine methyl ester synthase n=1 Tax=Nesidiocoris tenuis TaxID=355587 RepID=A0ABN7AHW7_9HEMI|nr:Diphthine synthase [Nesidiocoris tenuis]
MFYIVGIGLGDVKDITVQGLEIVKNASRVYLESYTSILTVGKHVLEEFYGREVIVADRDMVETGSDSILAEAADKDIALLVVGDPFSATTHTDIALRARQLGIRVRVVHNASIMNAIGCCGLQLYRFGETVSIPFWTESWKPDSFYEKIANNKLRGLHTLCLLDIKVKEPTLESMCKKKKEYMPPMFMTVSQAASQLLQICSSKKDSGSTDLPIDDNTEAVGVARVGCDAQRIVRLTLKEMAAFDLGPPLHSLVIVGQLDHMEDEYLSAFSE